MQNHGVRKQREFPRNPYNHELSECGSILSCGQFICDSAKKTYQAVANEAFPRHMRSILRSNKKNASPESFQHLHQYIDTVLQYVSRHRKFTKLEVHKT